jgi:hypothetical protein
MPANRRSQTEASKKFFAAKERKVRRDDAVGLFFFAIFEFFRGQSQKSENSNRYARDVFPAVNLCPK